MINMEVIWINFKLGKNYGRERPLLKGVKRGGKSKG